jgi:hypothetical protein
MAFAVCGRVSSSEVDEDEDVVIIDDDAGA